MKALTLPWTEIRDIIAEHVAAKHGLRHVQVELTVETCVMGGSGTRVSARVTGEPEPARYACGCMSVDGVVCRVCDEHKPEEAPDGD